MPSPRYGQVLANPNLFTRTIRLVDRNLVAYYRDHDHNPLMVWIQSDLVRIATASLCIVTKPNTPVTTPWTTDGTVGGQRVEPEPRTNTADESFVQ